MTLKEFQKHNVSTRTRYVIHQGDKDPQTIMVDYMSDDAQKLNTAVQKRMELETLGAKVRFIGTALGHLVVDVDLPKEVEFHV